jgi:hypothetical protein
LTLSIINTTPINTTSVTELISRHCERVFVSNGTILARVTCLVRVTLPSDERTDSGVVHL